MTHTQCLPTLGMLLFLLAPACAQEGGPTEGAASVRTIPIPKREHGYSNFDSTVIASQGGLDKFLKTTSKKDDMGWNDRTGFEKALAQAKIDFSREALVLLRHTEGSGSVRIGFRPPRVDKKRVICRIDRKEPEVGTADMAYYCFALAVPKAVISEVEMRIAGRKSTILSIKDGNSRGGERGK